MGINISNEGAFAMMRYPYSPAHMLRREQGVAYAALRLKKQEAY
jgi:hypothetical protein